MSMRVLLQGFTGYAQIDSRNVLMTSFSLEMKENIIQSNGVGKLYYENKSNKLFSRYKMNAVRDFPEYRISITAEADYYLLDYVFRKIANGWMSRVNVKFEDKASSILYDFEDCFLTSLDLSVSNNAVAIVVLQFAVFKDEIDIEFCYNRDYDTKRGRKAPGATAEPFVEPYPYPAAQGAGELVGDVLMPYWSWGIETIDQYGDDYFNDEDLFEFSISYSQSITPKYLCSGTASDKAPEPDKIIVGLPQVGYEFTYVVANKVRSTDYLRRSNEISISKRDVKVKYQRQRADGSEEFFSFLMKDCYPESYSPSYVNKGDANKVSVSGIVYGRIEYPV